MPYTDARMAEVERLLRYQNPRTGRSPSRETCPAGDVQSVELLRQEYEEGLALMAEFLGAKDTAMALLKEQCDSEVERKHILAGLKERGMLNALKKKMTEHTALLQEAEKLRHAQRDALHREILQERDHKRISQQKDKEVAELRERLVDLQRREADFVLAVKRGEDDKARIAGLEAALTDLRNQRVVASPMREPPRSRQRCSQSPTHSLPPTPSTRSQTADTQTDPPPPPPPPAPPSIVVESDRDRDSPAASEGWSERVTALQRELAVVEERCQLFEAENALLHAEAEAAHSSQHPLPPLPPKVAIREAAEHKKIKQRLEDALALSIDLKGALNESRAKNKRQEDRLLIKNAELIEIDKKAKRLGRENRELEEMLRQSEHHGAAATEEELQGLHSCISERDDTIMVLEERITDLQRTVEATEAGQEEERAEWEAKEQAWESSPRSSTASAARLSEINVFDRYDKSEERALLKTLARQNEMISSLKAHSRTLKDVLLPTATPTQMDQLEHVLHTSVLSPPFFASSLTHETPPVVSLNTTSPQPSPLSERCVDTSRVALEKTLARQNEVIAMLKQDLAAYEVHPPGTPPPTTTTTTATPMGATTSFPHTPQSVVFSHNGPTGGTPAVSNKYLSMTLSRSPVPYERDALETVVDCISYVRRHVRTVQGRDTSGQVAAADELAAEREWRGRGVGAAVKELQIRVEAVLGLNLHLVALRKELIEAWRGWDGEEPIGGLRESHHVDIRGEAVDCGTQRAAWLRLQPHILSPPAPSQLRDVANWRDSYRKLLEEMTSLETAVLTHPALRPVENGEIEEEGKEPSM